MKCPKCDIEIQNKISCDNCGWKGEDYSFHINFLEALIAPEYLTDTKFNIKYNKSDFDTIMIIASPNMYRDSVNNMFCRIKLSGEKPYISFRDKYIQAFKKLYIQTETVKSDIGYFRIPISDFFNDSIKNSNLVKSTINQMFIDTLCFPSFGCCDKYERCSDAKKCLHDDLLYATSCMYRKNLESGKIFYGNNMHKSEEQLKKIASIDIETPNHKSDSICSIGIVSVDENGIIHEFYSLVNPNDYFDDKNIEIHGITPLMVTNAPLFSQIWEQIENFFSEHLIVGHNIRFDLSVIRKALRSNNIQSVNPFFIDTLDISRRYVKDTEDHKLNTLCKHFGVCLSDHHNALCDSQAAYHLFCKLIEKYSINTEEFIKSYDFSEESMCSHSRKRSVCETTAYLKELQGILIGVMSDNRLDDEEIFTIKYWMDTHMDLAGNYPFDKIYKTLKSILEDNIITEDERSQLTSIIHSTIQPIESDNNIILDSDITGKTICLTGEFQCMSRKDFECMLSEHGAVIKNSIIKKLDYLVVGDLGSDAWIQGNYGTKIKKAMENNEKGSEIVIIKESDFIKIFEI